LNVDKKIFTKLSADFNRTFDNGRVLIKREVRPQSTSCFSLEGDVLLKHEIVGSYMSVISQPKSDRLSRFIGVHENLLWLANHSGKLYALDVITGEEIHSAMDYGTAKYYALDSEQSRLISLKSDSYNEINIANGAFTQTTKDTTSVFKQLELIPGIKSHYFPFNNTHMFFCDNFQAVVGAFNINTQQVDWTHDLYDTRDYSTIMEMDYCEDRLYVLDNANSLHVFSV